MVTKVGAMVIPMRPMAEGFSIRQTRWSTTFRTKKSRRLIVQCGGQMVKIMIDHRIVVPEDGLQENLAPALKPSLPHGPGKASRRNGSTGM